MLTILCIKKILTPLLAWHNLWVSFMWLKISSPNQGYFYLNDINTRPTKCFKTSITSTVHLLNRCKSSSGVDGDKSQWHPSREHSRSVQASLWPLRSSREQSPPRRSRSTHHEVRRCKTQSHRQISCQTQRTWNVLNMFYTQIYNVW